MKHERRGSIGAILDEYEKALIELKAVLADVTDAELLTLVAANAADENCRSIQTILAHVVRAGYTYASLLAATKGPKVPLRKKIYHSTVAAFVEDLDAMFIFSEETLAAFSDAELENFGADKRIRSPWGQSFDMEQLLEHAIVHILRHRRQIRRFLEVIRGERAAL